MDYREVPESHRTAYREILQYAFSPESGPGIDDEEEREQPAAFHRRGLYDRPATADVAADDTLDVADLRTVCGWFDFTMRVRGDWHRVAGVSAVASPPETRRRGYIGAMLDSLLDELRGEGVRFSVLWPFKYAFYRQFGWALSNHYARTTVSPSDLERVAASPEGRFRRLSTDDWPEMAAVHDAVADHPLAMDRTEDWWRLRTFRGWEKDRYAYGWERDGSLRGYVVYTVEADDETTLAVNELVAVDRTARTHLYRFLRDHDSQVDAVRIPSPVETSLLETVEDPYAPAVTLRPGAMARLVDVPAALEAVSYPDDAAADLVVGVADDRCDWNDGAFALSVRDGVATCEATDADPDVAVDVGSLSQVVVGALTASELVEYGDLTAVADGAAATLDELFPAPDPAPYLREGF